MHIWFNILVKIGTSVDRYLWPKVSTWRERCDVYKWTYSLAYFINFIMSAINLSAVSSILAVLTSNEACFLGG
jgi:hypothetical protein